MIQVKLLGTPTCRRYVKMRQVIEETADKLGLNVAIEEVNDSNTLAQNNPLNLPQLYIEGFLVASRNPPRSRDIEDLMLRSSTGL